MSESMEVSGFQLDPQTLTEVLDLLDACFSPQKAMLPDFQQKLAHMETLHNNVEFNFYVLYILSGGRTSNSNCAILNNQIPVHIRIAAGLLIKNNIRKLYKNFPPSLIYYMRQNLLPLLADDELHICKTAANIISFLALESGYEWSDLLPTLFNMIDPKNENSMKAIFTTLSNICEDMTMGLNVNALEPQNPHMQLLLFIIDKLLAVIQNLQLPTYQAIALGCINNFLTDMSEHIVRRPIGFLNLLFSLAEHNDQQIKRNVCQSFHTLVMVSDLLDPHLLNIFEYMLQRLTKPHEEYDVALEATDFWQTIVEDELHNNHIFNLLPRLVPLLIVNLRLSERDFLTSDINSDGTCKENNDSALGANIKPVFRKNKSTLNESTDDDNNNETNDYTWTLRKVSASTLDKLAVIFHSQILPVVFASLEPLMRQNEDWVVEESVILIFGAIADGCSKEMAQYLDQTIPFFVRCLNSQKPIIRSTAIWTVGRYAHWLTEPSRKNYLEVILRAILERTLDPSSKVQGSALVSIAILAEESRENFVSYIPFISQILVHCANACKGQTLIALYDALAALFDSVEHTTEDPIMKTQIIPWIVERWHQQTRSLLRETLPLMDCFCSLIVAMGYNFQPYLEIALKNCFDIIQYTLTASANAELVEDEDKDFMILALDTVSTIVERLPKMAPAVMKIYNVVPLLPAVAKDECLSVKQSFYSLVGELARHSIDLLTPIMEPLMELIAKEISDTNEIFPRDKEHFNVYNNAIWAFGEIIFRANPKKCHKYIGLLLPKLLNYVGAVHFIPVLRENSVICICYFGLHWPNEISSGIAPNLGDICACITEIASTEEKKLCLMSIAHMGSVCPALVSNNFIDVIKAFISWNGSEIDSRLCESIKSLFAVMKNNVDNDRWNQFWTGALDNNTKQLLHVKYGNYGLFDKSYNRKVKKTHIFDSSKASEPLDLSIIPEVDAEKRTLDQSSNEEDVSEETCFKDKALILYYNFEKQKYSHSRVPDRSGCDNHGVMDVGTMIFSENNSSCGSAAYLWSHDIKIIASSFQNPPKTGLSVSMWVKLIWSNGVPKELFSVNGPHFGVLSLRVVMDSIIWTYRRPNNSIVYSVLAYNAFPHLNIRKESNYSHIAATYNALTGVAQIFVNGAIMNRTVTSIMVPFSYWGNNINIGGNFRGMPFKGTVDEIKLFNYALDSSSVDVLAHECHFGPSKDNFEIFKRSKIPTRTNIESSASDSTVEKDTLSIDPSFDDALYKDVSDNDDTYELTSDSGDSESNVYERESDQSLSSLNFKEDMENDSYLRESTDVIS